MLVLIHSRDCLQILRRVSSLLHNNLTNADLKCNNDRHQSGSETNCLTLINGEVYDLFRSTFSFYSFSLHLTRHTIHFRFPFEAQGVHCRAVAATSVNQEVNLVYNCSTFSMPSFGIY